MTRVVADSNVYISALQFGGSAGLFLVAAERFLFVLLVSEVILTEVRDVLARKFKWSSGQIEAGILRIQLATTMVSPQISVSACVDLDDDRILEVAVAGDAAYLVTGNNHLLRMGSFRGVQIVKLRVFLDALESPKVISSHA